MAEQVDSWVTIPAPAEAQDKRGYAVQLCADLYVHMHVRTCLAENAAQYVEPLARQAGPNVPDYQVRAEARKRIELRQFVRAWQLGYIAAQTAALADIE